MNCGFGQFSHYLGMAISKNNLKHDLTFMLPKSAIDFFTGVSFEEAKKWKRHPYYLFLKHLFPQKKYDVWHSTEQFSKFFPFHSSTPMVLTIHDLNFLREKDKRKIAIYRKRVQKRVNRATIITTISNFVAAEISENLDLQGKEIKVIYNGLNLTECKPIKPSFPHINQNYLFTIGQVVPKKNFHVLIDFLVRTPYNLVIAGQNSSQYAQSIKDRIKDEQLNQRIVVPGTVNEGEKKWLYQNCTAFLFPSLTEGFGLPVIEAMHYGKPVFISNSTSLPEIAGKYGFYWENYNPEHMQKIFEKGLTYYAKNPEFRDLLVKHAKEFSWDNAAKEYINLYENLLRRTKNS